MDTFPWLQPLQERITQLATQRRLPHAMMISGGTGMGITSWLTWFESYVLCQHGSLRPCGQCHACQLHAAGTHPDGLRLQPDGKAQLIKVDAVRQVVNFAHSTAQAGGQKVIVIESAERMNTAAANALLKILEEPPAGTFLLLQTDDMNALLPTIRSRVQRLSFAPPTKEQSITWLVNKGVNKDTAKLLLALHYGQPCTGLAAHEQGILVQREPWIRALAQHIRQPMLNTRSLESFLTTEPEVLLRCWTSWVTDIIRVVQTGSTEGVVNLDMIDQLPRIAEQYPQVQPWFRLYDALQDVTQSARLNNNLNWQLLLESFWLRIPSILK